MQWDNNFQALEKQVREVEADIQAGRKNTGQRTVFYDMLTNDDLRAEEKQMEHLKGAAQVLVAAVCIIVFAMNVIQPYH